MLFITQHSRHAKLFKYIITYLSLLTKQCSLIKDIPKIEFTNSLSDKKKKEKKNTV